MGIYLVRRSPEKKVSVMGIHLGKPFWNKGSPSWESTWENPFRIKGFLEGPPGAADANNGKALQGKPCEMVGRIKPGQASRLAGPLGTL